MYFSRRCDACVVNYHVDWKCFDLATVADMWPCL
uniref:Uncharacterized protein n=1 Tax=Triticum urartu TaxID=4572 RepID=A0A8R7QGS7_TRIUA